MSNSTNEPSREPIREPTKRMDLDDVLPNNLSSKKTRVDLIDRDHKFDETCSAFRMVACEHQCLNGKCNAFQLIAYLDFNRFPQNSVEADLDFRDLQRQLFNNIISDSVFSDFQRQLFINIKANIFASLVCELVTSKNQIKRDKSSATFKLVVASVSNNNASSFNGKPSSTFQLVVASVDWITKGISSFHRIKILTFEGAQAPLSKLIFGCGYSEISFHFCEDCRIFCEGVKDDQAITMADHANSKLQLIVECLFLLRSKDKSETMTSSLLLFCVKDAPASMMVTHAKLKLQLIVASIRRALNARSTTSIQENNFQLIVEHLIPHSEGEYIYLLNYEGAQATPHYSGQLIVHSIVDSISKPTQLIVESKYSKRFLHFREDCGIFCEGEWGFGRNLAFSPNLAFCRNLAFGLNQAFGCNQAFGRNMAFGPNQAFGRNLAFGRNWPSA